MIMYIPLQVIEPVQMALLLQTNADGVPLYPELQVTVQLAFTAVLAQLAAALRMEIDPGQLSAVPVR